MKNCINLGTDYMREKNLDSLPDPLNFKLTKSCDDLVFFKLGYLGTYHTLNLKSERAHIIQIVPCLYLHCCPWRAYA